MVFSATKETSPGKRTSRLTASGLPPPDTQFDTQTEWSQGGAMRVRVEVRPARRIPNPKPGSLPRSSCKHLRGLLILGDKRRVVLGTVPLPLMDDDDVALLLRRSAPTLRSYVPDDRLLHLLLGQLAVAAEPHRATPDAVADREREDDAAVELARTILRRRSGKLR